MQEPKPILDYASKSSGSSQIGQYARVFLSLNLIAALGLHLFGWFRELRGDTFAETGLLQLSMCISAIYIVLAIVMAVVGRTGLIQLALDAVVGGLLVVLNIFVLGVH